jgi:hypothetical protein
MDPITIILTALATGAAKAAADVAPDAYKSLKALIQKKFAGKPAAEMVLDEYEKDPQTYSAPLKKSLIEAGADKDEEILALLEQIKTQAQAAGTVTNIGQGAKGIIGQTVTEATIIGDII